MFQIRKRNILWQQYNVVIILYNQHLMFNLSTTINDANYKCLKSKKELSLMQDRDNNIFKDSNFDYYM
jgi:hypothetical protein